MEQRNGRQVTAPEAAAEESLSKLFAQGEGDLYRGFFEAAHDAIFIETREGRIVDVNPAACELLGYSRQELRNLSLRDLLPPDQAPLAQAILQQEIQDHGLSFCGQNIRKDGTAVALEVRVKPVAAVGGELLVVIARDVSERRAAEQQKLDLATFNQLRDIFAHLPHVFWVVGMPEREMQHISASAKQMFGIEPERLMNERGLWRQTVYPADLPYLEERLRTLQRGEPLEFEFRILSASGNPRWVKAFTVPSLDEQGWLHRVYGVLLDIENEKTVRERLMRQWRLLQGVAKAAALLVGEGDTAGAIRQALGVLTESMQADQGFLFIDQMENALATGLGECNCVDWHNDSGRCKDSQESCLQVRSSYSRILAHWRGRIGRGEIVFSRVNELPEAFRPVFLERGIRGLVLVPVFLERTYWGTLVLESCDGEWTMQEGEAPILLTLSSSIGGALQRSRYEHNLRQQSATLQAIFHGVKDGLIVLDEHNRVIEANAEAGLLLGLQREELVGLLLWSDFSAPATQIALAEGYSKAAGAGTAQFFEWQAYRPKDQRPVAAEVFLGPICYRHAGCVLATIRDVTQRRQQETEMRLAAKVYENALEGIIITDSNGNIQTVNQAFSRITGYEAAEVVQRNPRLLQSGRHDQTFYREMWRSLLQDGRWEGEIWNRHKCGQLIPEWLTISSIRDAADAVTHYIAVFRDISERKRYEEHIRHQAYHDALTNLPNRLLFKERLDVSLQQAQRDAVQCGVVYLDLDGFKQINDSLGHDMGDKLLVAVADRLRGCARQGDTVARMGGDEFTIIVNRMKTSGDAAIVAERVLQEIGREFWVEGHELRISASVGISLFPQDGTDAGSLLKKADMAMYQAKHGGRNRFVFFAGD